jgi:inosine-uridine nucleoside N-ribohydrolase
MLKRRLPVLLLRLAGLGLLAGTIIPLTAAMARPATSARLPIFLSTDVGCEIDDQWPMLHLLGDPRFDLRVIASAQAPGEAIPPPPATNSATLARHIIRDRLRLANPPQVVSGSNEPLASVKDPRESEAATALLRTSRRFNSSNRLTVLVIGAATDVASALLQDQTLQDRIRIVAMGFQSAESGDEFNIRNDPHAWRVILGSRVPLVVGDQAVTTRRLSLTRAEAQQVLKGLGPIGAWLLRDYDVWYDRVTRSFKNPGRPDGPPSWPIWDESVVAHLLGMTQSEVRARPVLTDDLKLVSSGSGTVTWVTDIDRAAVFSSFQTRVARLAKRRGLVDQPCVTVAREANACWRQQP